MKYFLSTVFSYRILVFFVATLAVKSAAKPKINIKPRANKLIMFKREITLEAINYVKCPTLNELPCEMITAWSGVCIYIPAEELRTQFNYFWLGKMINLLVVKMTKIKQNMR